MKLWLITALLVVFIIVVSGNNGPEVEIRNGKLEGKYMRTRNGRKFSGFLAIPYAKPPLADLRFKDPEPAESWTGVRRAVEDSPVCLQRNPYVRSSDYEGEEDCLYLNVYTPQLPSTGSDPLPVMIFFHGGGWICGGGTSMWYGPDILLDRDVVLVVPNYRLGPLGFLSTEDEVVPGNMGMKDQVLAMKWIQENIASFGGDPNSVTGFGESAGGASVHLHMVSPLSKGLMHRGIAQSGTALTSWAVAPKGTQKINTQKLAKSLNCPTDCSKKMIECLRKSDALDIIKKDEIFWTWDFDPMIPFKPVIERKHSNAFLIEYPRKTIKEGRQHPIPWITGITSAEGALKAASLFTNKNLLEDFDKDFDKLAPLTLEYDVWVPDVDTVTKKLRKFYFKDSKIENTTESLVQTVNMFTDGWFGEGLHEAVNLHLKYANTPVYIYYFSYRGISSFTKIFGDPYRDYGVCHADELQYLFPVSDGLFPDVLPTETDKKVTEIMTNLWVNFAKTGNPSYENNEVEPIIWDAVSSKKLEYLHIKNDEDVKMETNLLSDRLNFWASLPTRKYKAGETYKDEL